MVRTLYCRSCSATRTFDTTRRSTLTCFSCGGTVFTTMRTRPVRSPVFFTQADLRFLKSLRIAADAQESRN